MAEIVSEPHDARFGTWMTPGSRAAKPSQLREMLGSWVRSFGVEVAADLLRGHVDERRLAGDRDRLLERAQLSETGTVVVVPTITGRSRRRNRLKPVSSAETW